MRSELEDVPARSQYREVRQTMDQTENIFPQSQIALQTAPPRKGAMTHAGVLPERPSLASNVQLVGAMKGTGFKDQQWLIEREGQFIQVTELLYRIAELASGERTLKEIAAGVTAS